MGCSYPGCIWKFECGSALEKGHPPLERGQDCPGSGGNSLVCTFQQNTRAQLAVGGCMASAFCSMVVASATVMGCGFVY